MGGGRRRKEGERIARDAGEQVESEVGKMRARAGERPGSRLHVLPGEAGSEQRDCVVRDRPTERAAEGQEGKESSIRE